MPGQSRDTRHNLFLHIVILTVLVCHTGYAQKFERITPEVLSTTILLDRDTDLENLREQIVRVYENTSIAEVQQIRAWQEFAVSLRNVMNRENITIDKDGVLRVGNTVIYHLGIDYESVKDSIVKLKSNINADDTLTKVKATDSLLILLDYAFPSIKSTPTFLTNNNSSSVMSVDVDSTSDSFHYNIVLKIIFEDTTEIKKKLKEYTRQDTLIKALVDSTSSNTNLVYKLVFSIRRQKEKKTILQLFHTTINSLSDALNRENALRLSVDPIGKKVDSIADSAVAFFDSITRTFSEIDNHVAKTFNPSADLLWRDVLILKNSETQRKHILISRITDAVLLIASSFGKPEAVKEAQRLKTYAEIGIELQRILANSKGKVDSGAILMQFGSKPDSSILTQNMTAIQATRDVLLAILSSVRAGITDRLGIEHPSVQHFDVLYTRLFPLLNEMESATQQNSLPLVVIPISDIIRDAASLKIAFDTLRSNLEYIAEPDSSDRFYTKYIRNYVAGIRRELGTFRSNLNLDIARRVLLVQEQQLRKATEILSSLNDTSTAKEKALKDLHILKRHFEFDKGEHFLRALTDFLSEQISDFVINTLLPRLRQAAEDRGSFEFFGKIGFVAKPEIGNTLVYKFINGHTGRMEVFTNLFFNDLAKDDKNKDSAAVKARNFTIGFSGKGLVNPREAIDFCLIPDIKFELGLFISTSIQDIRDWSWRNFGKRVGYNVGLYVVHPGLKWLIKIPTLHRLYVQYERHPTFDLPNTLDIGYELRFKNARFVSGFFINGSMPFKSSPSTGDLIPSLGITFPALK